MTYFAYWFGNEKVVARIVEKERATASYGYITAPPRQRDPVLVELIGKNTFRARIVPVEPNADLKIEMRWVQPLSTDAKSWIYTFQALCATEGGLWVGARTGVFWLSQSTLGALLNS
ncbi:MAG: Vault protein inter-alpha-trypsin domain, partial [Abditibacteriota bacterium]|nr:Vault protein inter-alpha-trypsin domain [Abditibacteriota bacterium]